jgi:hypothetical protein
VLSLDQLGQRYGLLPSRVIQEASTFDLVIMDMALSYEKYIQDSSKKDYVPDVSVEELIKIKERS